MAITVDALTKSTSATFQHTCSGSDRFLMVAVAYIPPTWQEVVSIKYDGLELSLASCMTGDKLALCVGYLVAPSAGVHDVEITMSEPATMLCKAASYNGVAQANPVWKTNNGVGDMVTDIPVNTFMKVDAMTIGVGAVNDVEAGNDKLYGGQVLVWDDSDAGEGIRMDGISIIGSEDVDSMPLPNHITKPSCWAVIIVGVLPA